MYQKNAGMGTLYIALGILLFVFSIGEWMMKLGVTLLGLYLINYGLALRGTPSLMFMVLRWFDRTKYY